MNQAAKMPICLLIYINTISVTVTMYNTIKKFAYISQGVKPRSSSVDPVEGRPHLIIAPF